LDLEHDREGQIFNIQLGDLQLSDRGKLRRCSHIRGMVDSVLMRNDT
jgi:hypothetical protein